MTNSQCIAVAEKVWEYKSWRECWKDFAETNEYWRIDRLPVDNEIRLGLEKSILSGEVESWSGFGRTVEAMQSNCNDQQKDRMCSTYEGFLNGGVSKEMLWERTHLAALEAMEQKL